MSLTLYPIPYTLNLKPGFIMSYYPIYLELDGKTVLVVGGGNVAQRKVETLLQYGAVVNIVSKEFSPRLKELAANGNIRQIGEAFDDKYLDNTFLAFAATDDPQLNHAISESARKRGLMINAVDQPVDCDFIVPSILRKGDLSIAISTSGKSPALAKSIRRQLDSQFGKEYESFLILMGRLRKEILSLGLPQEENSRIFHEIVDSDILKALAEDDFGKVGRILRSIVPEGVVLEKCLDVNI